MCRLKNPNTLHRGNGTSLILRFSPVQLVLLISSAGRFALQVTVSLVTSRTVKTVFSKFFSSGLDLEDAKQISQSECVLHCRIQNRKNGCFLNRQTRRRESFSHTALELRMCVGQLHEELVLHLQRGLSEGGGWSVVQSCRPANVNQK